MSLIQAFDSTHPGRDPGPFGTALRRYRQARRLSQLDLALECEVSARHLSFLESGRSQPSREMVELLARGLRLTREAHNALLQSAGFVAVFPVTPLESAVMGPFRRMVGEMMERHAPYPALLCDRHWNVLDANGPARLLLEPLRDGPEPINIIAFFTENQAAMAAMRNLADLQQEWLGRLQLEAMQVVDDPVLHAQIEATEQALSRHPKRPARPARDPIVPIIMDTPLGTLQFLTTMAHFGTSEDVTVRDLRLELLFPADEATRAVLTSLPMP